jgi:succinylglutamic semialdehyde dehydrogenase
VRIETLRPLRQSGAWRQGQVCRPDCRETGKPLWEAATEVDAVVGKVDISVSAYGERTSQRRMEGALGAKVAVRHKPHGVLAVLGPYNFSGAPAQRPHRPGAIAGNAVVFKPSEKTPAVGELLVQLLHEAGVPEGCVRLLIGGPDQGKALAAHPGIDGLLAHRYGPPAFAPSPFSDAPQKILAYSSWRNNPLWYGTRRRVRRGHPGHPVRFPFPPASVATAARRLDRAGTGRIWI